MRTTPPTWMRGSRSRFSGSSERSSTAMACEPDTDTTWPMRTASSAAGTGAGPPDAAASGAILTKLMADAMNRSIRNIIVGGFGTGDAVVAAVGGSGSIQSVAADDAAIQLAYAQSVIVVPGYGLAVAQAQHAVRELGEILESRGVNVVYAIHPVAGRMPGHMNVLPAEANVPYPQLREMEDINPEFSRADVALVVGANDVTNPAARSDPGSPIYGMPILEQLTAAVKAL